MTVATEALLERLAGSPERFPGALLLTGPSAARLERESRRLAARLLCPGDDPRGECRSCQRAAAEIHPDLMTLLPEGVGQIRIERVREALAFAAGRPYESARRVVRVPNAELLGPEASNALLKSLEEPGDRVRWILATTRPDGLLATIRSRTARAALPPLSLAEQSRFWQDRGFPEDAARDLALFAEEDETDPAARLAEGRELRQKVVAALDEGLVAGRVAALVLAAELLAGSERDEAHVLAELLADAALSTAGPPAEALRHRAVAGLLAAIARRVPRAALVEAAIAAAEPPADNRRGNRRMHFEKLLLGLYEASRRS